MRDRLGTEYRAAGPLRAQLMRVGREVFPVYGDERCGFTIDPVDMLTGGCSAGRYATLDELYFALVNFNSAAEGRA